MITNDITKCVTKDCPKKEQCYRYTVKPEKRWQSYSDFTELCKIEDYRYYICAV